MQSQNPQRRKDEIVVTELEGEVLVYDKKTNKAFSLNKTSALIWELCDGRRSLSEISQSVGEKLNASVDDGLVWLALEQLRQENLIENEVIMPDSLVGLSRRQAIRKVGLAAAVTLPFISSLVAPTALSAQSGPLVPAPISGQPVSVPRFAPVPLFSPMEPLAPLNPVAPSAPRFTPVPLFDLPL